MGNIKQMKKQNCFLIMDEVFEVFNQYVFSLGNQTHKLCIAMLCQLSYKNNV